MAPPSKSIVVRGSSPCFHSMFDLNRHKWPFVGSVRKKRVVLEVQARNFFFRLLNHPVWWYFWAVTMGARRFNFFGTVKEESCKTVSAKYKEQHPHEIHEICEIYTTSARGQLPKCSIQRSLFQNVDVNIGHQKKVHVPLKVSPVTRPKVS